MKHITKYWQKIEIGEIKRGMLLTVTEKNEVPEDSDEPLIVHSVGFDLDDKICLFLQRRDKFYEFEYYFLTEDSWFWRHR
jgi:hypothetical protein